MRGLTLDTGALIALERKDARMTALLERMLAHPESIVHVPAGVVAQAFRDGSRQVRLARLLNGEQTRIVDFDRDIALAAGVLLGVRGTSDVVDASVVLCARVHRQSVITSDVEDLRRLDARVELHAV
jgi:predicted nucleic acid-binding protein